MKARPAVPEKLARSLLLLGELHDIDDALGREGIGFVVLKGLPLAVRLTGRIHGRAHRIRDNDVLVRRTDVRAAVNALGRLGYCPLPGVSLERELLLNFEYELVRVRQRAHVSVEIHWAPFPHLLHPVEEDWLLSRSELVDVRGRSFRVLDRALTILQLASHYTQHHGRARWVLDDLAMAWNAWGATLDLADLADSARRTGLVHVLDFALSCAREAQLLTVERPPLDSDRARLVRLAMPTPEAMAERELHPARRLLLTLGLAPVRRIPGYLRVRAFPPLDAFGLGSSPATYVEYGRRLLRVFSR